jgi:hypothetical protein
MSEIVCERKNAILQERKSEIVYDSEIVYE